MAAIGEVVTLKGEKVVRSICWMAAQLLLSAMKSWMAVKANGRAARVKNGAELGTFPSAYRK